MTTKTITVDSLIADYAEPIASEVGLDTSDYDQTAHGLASLLRDASEDTTGQVSDWLEDAADDLTAIALLGDESTPKTQELLTRVDRLLYEAKHDLELG